MTSSIVNETTCGYLTVLENRSRPTGRTIRLFVARFEPPQGILHPDPMVVPGSPDLGRAADFGGLASGAQRVAREVIAIEDRGTGLSKPNLDCPEVEGLSRGMLALRLSDPRAKAMVLAAVTACHDRLVSEGIDLGSYTIEEAAADVNDLRVVLGLGKMNLTTFGTDSRISLEVMRDYPGAVRTLILDSPQFSGVDNLADQVTATREAIRAVAAACDADRACHRSFPDPGGTLRRTLASLDRTPVASPVASSGAGPTVATVDGGLLLRAIRDMLLHGGGIEIPVLPAVIYQAHGRRFGPSAAITGSKLLGLPPLCLGYARECGGELAYGVSFSSLCHDDAPFVDQQALEAVAGGAAGYAEDFVSNPNLWACDVWRVGKSPPSDQAIVHSDIPVLIFEGQFQPLVSSATLRRVTSELSHAYVVTVPSQTTNLLGFTECPRSIRNAWIDHPDSAPSEIDCLAETPKLVFATTLV